uniref:Kinesin-like protein n=2 Tax=Macrostomum lignano TaxID=282301 RepID=A0A1I8H7S5_9PLAT
MDAKQETISVVVRLRPLIERELNSCCKEEWLAEDSTVRTADGTKRFCFDGVYGKSHQTQALYTQAVKPIVTSCMEGVSGTVFAYGQTSSGKTHTMYGSVQDPGVIVLALRDIFALQEMATEREFLVSISFLEIYNERVIDLLSNDPDKKVSVIIERTKSTLRNVKEEIVTSVDEVLNLLSKGEAQRHIGETNMNERSSRSHTILRLAIESRCREEDGVIWNSVLNLVDLAGSERVSESGASGTTLKEACNINSSLSSLCLVIRQLSENSSYISFRDSKLTSILMSSLGGNSRTLIVCNITPAVYDQSQRTLNFASIAKTVKNKPVVNESVSDEAYRKRLEKQMESLKEQLLKMTCQKDRVEAENERLVRQMETSRVADENPRFGQLAEEQLSERQRVLHQMETLSRYCGASGIDDGDSSTGDVPAMLLRRRTWAPNSRRQLPDSGALRRCLLGAIGEEPPPPPPPPPPAPSLPSLSTASSQQQQQHQIFPPVGADSFDDN